MDNTINGRTPEEIRKGLECCNAFNACPSCPYEHIVDTEHGWGCVVIRNADTLAYIQQLESAQPKWISVDERLPDVCDLVLVIASGQPKENIKLYDAVLIASYWGEEGWIADGFDGWDKLNVSFWMPLPSGPKEG